MITKVSALSQMKELLKKQPRVVVDFYATSCEKCTKIAPAFDKLFEGNKDNFHFMKVDVDQSEELKNEYKIKSTPTFVLLKDGKEVSRVADADMAQLKTLMDKMGKEEKPVKEEKPLKEEKPVKEDKQVKATHN